MKAFFDQVDIFLERTFDEMTVVIALMVIIILLIFD